MYRQEDMEKAVHLFVRIIELVFEQINRKTYDLAVFQTSRAYRLFFQAIEKQSAIPHLSADLIKTFINTIKIVNVFMKYPELQTTPFVTQTLEGSKKAIEAFLMGRIKEKEVLEEFRKMDSLLNYLKQAIRYLNKKQGFLGLLQEPNLSITLEKRGELSLYAKLDGGKKPLPFGRARQLQAEFLSDLSNKQENSGKMLNFALKMMAKGAFIKAINAFQKLINHFPEYVPNSLNCIGACYFYLDEHEQALDYYRLALKSGAIPKYVEYNIWETCMALIDSEEDRNEKMRWKFYYEECFEQPKHRIQF